MGMALSIALIVRDFTALNFGQRWLDLRSLLVSLRTSLQDTLDE